jgi:methylenetetrahydrofolate dehydrogenase (NADP+)/methenyltetrahydrofolate cyclohydrolase
MGTELMDGTALAAEIDADTTTRVAAAAEWRGRAPCLATVLVGTDPSSVTYVRMKQARCARVGITSRSVELPRSTTTTEAVAAVRTLSQDPSVDGILVQHPAPAHVDERQVFEAIDPRKDVDGVTLRSFAAATFASGEGFPSCTPAAVLRLLDRYGVDLSGAHAVVLGRSAILGRPVGMLLLGRDATVTYCHSRTRDVASVVRTADVVVAAVGVPRFVEGSWLRDGCVVVDAGYNPGNVGDVDEVSAMGRAALLTPVPGGVGPVTIAVLLAHTVDAAMAG